MIIFTIVFMMASDPVCFWFCVCESVSVELRIEIWAAQWLTTGRRCKGSSVRILDHTRSKNLLLGRYVSRGWLIGAGNKSRAIMRRWGCESDWRWPVRINIRWCW